MRLTYTHSICLTHIQIEIFTRINITQVISFTHLQALESLPDLMCMHVKSHTHRSLIYKTMQEAPPYREAASHPRATGVGAFRRNQHLQFRTSAIDNACHADTRACGGSISISRHTNSGILCTNARPFRAKSGAFRANTNPGAFRADTRVRCAHVGASYASTRLLCTHTRTFCNYTCGLDFNTRVLCEPLLAVSVCELGASLSCTICHGSNLMRPGVLM